MIFTALTLWAASTHKSKHSSHHSSKNSYSNSKKDASTKDFMKTLDSRVNNKLKTDKEYQKIRNSIW